MGGFWADIYLVLAGVALAQAALVALQTWEHRRFARSRLARLPSCRVSGRAMVLVPCRGLDVALEENLQRLFAQDYDDYEIVFIVQSVQDPACATIRRLQSQHPRRASRLVVAGPATTCGQKVHNLRAATERIDPRIEYLVFVDSDAQPRREWLRAFLARLEDRRDGRGQRIGAATGYRWMIPARPGLAQYLLANVNANVATLLGSRGRYPVWGGSWAIRRDVFEWIGLRDAWEGTLSDDLVAARVLGRRRLVVKFEPACMVASPWDGDLRQGFSFLRRQYLIGRYYAPTGWAAGLAAASAANLAWIASAALLTWGLAGGGLGAWLPGGVCAALFALAAIRAILHRSIARLYFPQQESRFRAAGAFDLWAGPLASLANWLGMIGSSVGRHVRWRDITYRLYRGGRSEIVDRPAEESQPPDAPPDDGQTLPLCREISTIVHKAA
ncbi:MAG: glycosyltransferase [Pirellulales bacterium]|nr:glycosyltransferase [Pirellulales bacterium]